MEWLSHPFVYLGFPDLQLFAAVASISLLFNLALRKIFVRGAARQHRKNRVRRPMR